jgi:phospholipid/cholesterol/gamma-HCH transport system substrate-binding protein
MRGLSTELKVGFFALVVLAIFTYMTFKVGGFEWIKKEGYVVYVYFENIAGLDEKTKIKVAGVDAGVIEKIELREGAAKLTLRMDPRVKLYSVASAAIKATGLLGDKYLEVKIGSKKPLLKSGDTIKNVTEVVDIDDMARNLSEVSSNINKLALSLNESLGTEEAKRSLKESILNLREITANINSAIISNDKRFKDVLDNINNLTASVNEFVNTNKEPFTTAMANFKDFSGSLKSDGPEVIRNLNKATKDFKALVEESRTSIKSTTESIKATSESIESIAKKIDSGEGTIGKLVKDDRLYESLNKAAEGVDKTIGAIVRFRTFITFQADYLTKSKDGKGYFYLTLQPRPDRYYILGVVSDPLGRVTTKETVTTGPSGTTAVEEKQTERNIEFTAQFAKRFKDVALRIGVTENTFGIGGDYFFNNDKGKVTADIWDFSNDEEGASSPHLRVGVDYFLFKHLFVSAGADNLLNKKWRGAYAGMGLRFEDEDFKYLFGAMPRISTR